MELQEKMPAGPGRKAVSFLRGKSFCPHCEHTLSWRDLFPVLSFLFLKGKCRYCKKRISVQYPLVELMTGLLFLLIFNHSTERFALMLGFSDYSQIIASVFNFINLALLFYISSVLIIIFIYDLKHYIIPDKVLLPAIAITVVYDFFVPCSMFHVPCLINYFLAAIIASTFFLIIFLISKGRAMGFGDVKIAVLMGLLLGLPNVLVALFLAFFFGAIIGIILMVFKKKRLKSEIPFGPFLITGTFIALLWGNQLVNWYLRMFVQ
jgi:prepilin signal peptidase PulO-like enzyme (type II secretory pathway)